MYIPAHFQENNPSEIQLILDSYPLATIIAHNENGLTANHIPLMNKLDEQGKYQLSGHISRNNPMLQDIKNGDSVMVIFRSEDSYISPNWMPSKQVDHKQVPSWNYQAVHLHGVLNFIDDVRYLRGLLSHLTRIHEVKTNANAAWRMSDAPPDYLDGMLSKIIAFTIDVDRVLAKSKLSQNKVLNDYEHIQAKMADVGKTTLHKAMGLHKKES